MGIQAKYIWMDGEMVDFDKATIPFLSTALHYGLAVFEGIRAYDTEKGAAVFRLQEHMQRLVDSARILGFRSLPYTVDELVQAAIDTVRVNELRSCYIRPLIYHSSPNPTLNMDLGVACVGIAAWAWGAYLGEDSLEKGVRMNISSYTRLHPNVAMTKAKISGNYPNSVMAKTEAVRLGFEEAIMLDPQGYVAECTGENLFLVRKGVIYTPHTGAILEGITRDVIMVLARDLNYRVVEEPVSRDQLYIADEIFVCGTAAEVVPVTEVDFRIIGSGKMGPVTRALGREFQAVIHGKHTRSDEWLTYL
jgi:branched-chain amino acid aminotransferase